MTEQALSQMTGPEERVHHMAEEDGEGRPVGLVRLVRSRMQGLKEGGIAHEQGEQETASQELRVTICEYRLE